MNTRCIISIIFYQSIFIIYESLRVTLSWILLCILSYLHLWSPSLWCFRFRFNIWWRWRIRRRWSSHRFYTSYGNFSFSHHFHNFVSPILFLQILRSNHNLMEPPSRLVSVGKIYCSRASGGVFSNMGQ